MLNNKKSGERDNEEQDQHQSRAGSTAARLDHRRWRRLISLGRFYIFDNGLVHCQYVT